eukprot:TRINITY_DN36150_c0_g1_i1.p1 TRINITY_DN36150_c0_g1~~TRINITY_DN36150_c0_g1_i1.p1  ORF type:complete len:238 (+),score=10.40 TRINITY_DN36150_c0_g1_i1:248-961(+)
MTSLMYFFGVLLALLPVMNARELLATSSQSSSSPMADGTVCHLPVNLNFKAPYCKGGPTSCLINHLPASSKNPQLRGRCRSDYAKGSFCSVGEFNFAVGVKNIPAYGPSTCETCTCKYNPKKAGSNKGQCVCDSLPACYVGTDGKVKGAGCPYPIQSKCVITTPGEGLLIDGVQTSKGQCQAPEVTNCVSAGPTWGPYFYAEGAKGVPYPGDRCTLCTCGSGGVLGACAKKANCTAS